MCAKLGYSKMDLINRSFSALLPTPETDLPALINLFKRLKKHPKGVKKSQPLTLRKKNSLIVTFSAHLKYSVDASEGQYITVLGQFDKFTKQKAQILVTKKGEILANNGSTMHALDLPELFLKDMGFDTVEKLLQVCPKDLQNLANSKASRVNLTSIAASICSENQLLTPGTLKNSIPLFESYFDSNQKSALNGPKKSSITSHDHLKTQEMHLDIIKPVTCSENCFIIELWKNQKKPNQESLDQSMDNQTDNRTLSRSAYHRKTKASGFYFKLDSKFRYIGGFEKSYAFEHSNLKINAKDIDDIETVDKSVRLLYNIKNRSEQATEVQRVVYGRGIRVKRLKDGNLIDWYEGMDIDSEFTDSEEERERQRAAERNKRSKTKTGGTTPMHRKRRFKAKGGRGPPAKANMGSRVGKHGAIMDRRSPSPNFMALSGAGSEKTYATRFTSAKAAKSKKSNRRRQQEELDDFDENTQFYRNLRMIEQTQSKSQIIKSLKTQKVFKSVICLIASILVAALGISGFQIYATLQKLQIADDLQAFTKIDYGVTFRNADVYNIMSRLQDICLIHNGTDFLYNPKARELLGDTNEAIVRQNLKSIKVSLDSFEDFNILIQENIEFLSIADKFSAYMSTKNIPMYRGKTAQNFSINEVVRQIVSTVVNILELPPKQITFRNADVDYFLINMIVNMTDGLNRFSRFTNVIKEQALVKQEVNIRFTKYFLAGVGAVFTLVFYVGVYCYYKQKETMVEAFYGFSTEQIEKVNKRLQRFLEVLQFAQISEDQMDLSLSDDSDQSGRALNGGNGQKSKMSVEEMMGSFKRRNRKGTLIPLIGVFRGVLLVSLTVFTLFLFFSAERQNDVVRESVKIMETVERIAVTETFNYEMVLVLELAIYRFLTSSRTRYFMDRAGELYTNVAYAVNDRALKVNIGLNFQFF